MQRANEALQDETYEQPKNEETFMTVQEIADFLKVDESSVSRWIIEGELKNHRSGENGNWRYSKADVIAFIWVKTNQLDCNVAQ